jgi:hypothetical protein
MSNIVKAPARVSLPPAQVLRPQTFDQLVQFANMAAKSKLVPKDFIDAPENIMLAVQMGSEIGLAPMQALQNIAVINGRPSVWGDAMLALCKASPVCDDVIETFDRTKMEATCIAKRVGKEPVIQTFSKADAVKAGLWKETPRTKKEGKNGSYEVDSGPWFSYPERMLQMRARGFALRDAFPDVLKGLISAEEARDMPEPQAETFRGTTIEADPVVERPKKATVSEWLAALEKELTEAPDSETVFQIVSRPEVQTAFNKFTNGSLTELERITQAADVRFRDADLVNDAQE